jgi:DNA-binding transcriptional regulator YiaG
MNIGAVLKQEITRLSRKEIRSELQATKKASAQYRRSIAALKRQVASLESQMGQLQRRALAKPAIAIAPTNGKVRFVAKGLKSQRARLGLSAADYGRLVGVSSQSVYNWEREHASPRSEQVQMIAELRSMGKREAQQRLEQLDARSAQKARKQ